VEVRQLDGGLLLELLYVHLPSGLSRTEVGAKLGSRLEAFRDSEERAAILEKGAEETMRAGCEG
jgi:hypothetical protein